MKTLYININNELIQSNEELEVLNYDLDSDFFFYLGEKIAKGCKVENENALITDFNTQDAAEDYQQIIAQWNEIKAILFGEDCDEDYEFKLPAGYIHWLKYHPQYVSVYDKNFSHGESGIIYIDLEELYEESVESMQRRILRKLQRDDLYRDIDEIVFNDDAVIRKSSIVRTIKDKYEGLGFKTYKKWLEGNKPQEDNNIPDIGIPITEEEDYSSDDLILLVNWICDEFEKEKTIDCRSDEKMMSKIYDITKNALNEYNNSWLNRCVEICIPYVVKYDSNGKPIHTTNFFRTLSKGLLHSLKYPNEVEDEAWGWEYVRYLGDDLTLKRYNHKYGIVDNNGIIIVQCEYNEIIQFRSGNIRLKQNRKYGLINKNKTINIPCLYDEIIEVFEHGVIKLKKEGVWYIIDKAGSILPIDDEDYFQLYGIVLGKTTAVLDSECEIKEEVVDHYKLYSYELNKDPNVIFFKIDYAPISKMIITSESPQYLTTLRKIKKTFVSHNPFKNINNLTLYNKSILRALEVDSMILLEYGIDERISMIDKMLNDISKQYENFIYKHQ